jgi:hypothetical protein
VSVLVSPAFVPLKLGRGDASTPPPIVPIAKS